MEYPVFSFDALTRNELAGHIKVVNLHDVEYYCWVHLPHEFGRLFKLYAMYNVSGSKTKPVDFVGHTQRECARPWIRFETSILDMSIGQHLYQLKLVNVKTNDILTLYFGYILQSDDPPKPYDYMKDIRKVWEEVEEETHVDVPSDIPEIPEVSFSIGDVNHDGVVDTTDADLIRDYINDHSVSIDLDLADVDNDGEITLEDRTQILRQIAGQG